MEFENFLRESTYSHTRTLVIILFLVTFVTFAGSFGLEDQEWRASIQTSVLGSTQVLAMIPFIWLASSRLWVIDLL